MNWWDELWLNEGFATWAASYALASLRPEWYPWADFLTGPSYIAAKMIDAKNSTHSIVTPINQDKNITMTFDSITYGKGGASLRMLSNHLGEETFLAGVQRYLKANLFGNTHSSQLWDALSDVSGQDVGKLMKTWINKPGHPVVSLNENPSKGTVTATQHRYLQSGSAENDDFVWPLFLQPRGKHGRVRRVQLPGRTTTFGVSEEFYKLNADQVGFYRVCYSPKRLEILAENVKGGLLSVEDRIGLVADALAMASSGYNGSTTSNLLTLLQVFNAETNVFVWKQVLSAVSTVLDTWIFESDAVINALKLFQQKLIQKCLRRIGWSFSKDEDVLEHILKSVIFSHASDQSEVACAAAYMFHKYINGDRSAINPNIMEPVLALVMRSEDAEKAVSQ